MSGNLLVNDYRLEDLQQVIREADGVTHAIFEPRLMLALVNVARATHASLARAQNGDKQLEILVEFASLLLLYGILMGQNGVANSLPTQETVH